MITLAGVTTTIIIVIVYVLFNAWCIAQITIRKGKLNRPLYLKVKYVPFYAIYYWNFVLKRK